MTNSKCYKLQGEVLPILNELEHKKLGWKVLTLKYDLGKSLSRNVMKNGMQLKKVWLNVLKDEKCM